MRKIYLLFIMISWFGFTKAQVMFPPQEGVNVEVIQVLGHTYAGDGRPLVRVLLKCVIPEKHEGRSAVNSRGIYSICWFGYLNCNSVTMAGPADLGVAPFKLFGHSYVDKRESWYVLCLPAVSKTVTGSTTVYNFNQFAYDIGISGEYSKLGGNTLAFFKMPMVLIPGGELVVNN